MAQNSRVAFTTTVGRAQYPWLNTPDSAFGGEPKYKTNLVRKQASARRISTNPSTKPI